MALCGKNLEVGRSILSIIIDITKGEKIYIYCAVEFAVGVIVPIELLQFLCGVCLLLTMIPG